MPDIVTDYGAVADAEWAQTTLNITVGTNILTASDAIWAVGDIGKSIVLPAPPFGSVHLTTIAGFTSATQITLTDNATATLTNYDAIIAWGTDSTAAFQEFKDDYQGDTVTLTIPAGVYLISSGNFGGMWDGITSITVNATGATLAGGAFQVQASAQYQFSGHTGYTASVSAGALSVTLLTPADASKFAVGGWAMMTGFDMQKYGYPTNNGRLEYHKIASIAGAVITFETPLVDDYLSTWPLYSGEVIGFPGDTQTFGGPATLYAMNPKFEHTSVVNGLTIAQQNQYGVSGMDLTFNDCVFEGTGQLGPHPTMAKRVVFNNCTATGVLLEVDKLVELIEVNGGTWRVLNYQSGNSIRETILDGVTVTESIIGSSWKFTIRNGCVINLWAPATLFFGYTNEVVVSDSEITNWSSGAVGTTYREFDGGAQDGIQGDSTMAGGVITIPAAYRMLNPSQWAITGSKLFFNDPNVGNLGSFTITDVADGPGGALLVHTDWPGGFPSRTYGGLGLWLQTHPAPICTFTNVTGCLEAEDLSRAPAGEPMWSYTSRDYTGDFTGAGPSAIVTGRIKYAKVTVTTPYTGATGTVTATVFPGWGIDPTDYSTNTNLQFTINLKEAGERILDVTAATPGYPISWTGAETGDTLPALTKTMWVGGNLFVIMNQDITAEAPGVWPEFTVEFITDQGFAAAPPLDTVDQGQVITVNFYS